MFWVYNKVTLKTKWYSKIVYSYKQENNRQKNKKIKENNPLQVYVRESNIHLYFIRTQHPKKKIKKLKNIYLLINYSSNDH